MPQNFNATSSIIANTAHRSSASNLNDILHSANTSLLKKDTLPINYNDSVNRENPKQSPDPAAATLKEELKPLEDNLLNWLQERESYGSRTSEEIPQEQEKTCWICLNSQQEEEEQHTHKVWTCPCKCAGTSKWVHEQCLLNWIKSAKNTKAPCCPQCKYPYKIKWPASSTFLELGFITLKLWTFGSKYIHLLTFFISQYLLAAAYGHFVCQFITGETNLPQITSFHGRLMFFLVMATPLEFGFHSTFLYTTAVAVFGLLMGVVPTVSLLVYLMVLMDRPIRLYRRVSNGIKNLRYLVKPRIYNYAEIRHRLLKRSLHFPLARIHETSDDIPSSSFILKLGVMLRNRPPRTPQSPSYWDQPIEIYVEYPRSNIFMAMTQTRVEHILNDQTQQRAASSRPTEPIQRPNQTNTFSQRLNVNPQRQDSFESISDIVNESSLQGSSSSLSLASTIGSAVQTEFLAETERQASTTNNSAIQLPTNQSQVTHPSSSLNFNSDDATSQNASSTLNSPSFTGASQTGRILTGNNQALPQQQPASNQQTQDPSPTSTAGSSSYHAIDPVLAERHVKGIIAVLWVSPLFVIATKAALFSRWSPLGAILHRFCSIDFIYLAAQLNYALNFGFDLAKFIYIQTILLIENKELVLANSAILSLRSILKTLDFTAPMIHSNYVYVTAQQLEYGLELVISAVLFSIIKEELIRKFKARVLKKSLDTHIENYCHSQ